MVQESSRTSHSGCGAEKGKRGTRRNGTGHRKTVSVQITHGWEFWNINNLFLNKRKLSLFLDAFIFMAVWSAIKPSFWNSPVSQRLFPPRLPEEGVWPATLICSSAATRSLIHSERGIELSQDEDMTSSAHSMSMIGRLTCRSGMLPGISLWVLNAASEQRPTTQMTSGGNPSPVA